MDVPQLVDLLSRFLARAIADEAVRPRYVADRTAKYQQPDRGTTDHVGLKHSGDTAVAVLEAARVLLSVRHGLARLSEIWGAENARRPVMQLSRRIHSILQEYLSSHDAAEAQRCLHELDAPHFHHELVYDAVVTALEGSDAQVR